MGRKEEAREDRKLKFIETLKRRQARDLLEPLGRKIQAFAEGKLAPEEVFKAVHHAEVQGEKLTKRYRNRPDVVLAEIAMDVNKFTTEIGEVGIKARQGDITSLFADAIVNPADPRGTMADGVAGAIKAAGGGDIEKEAVAKAPIAVGAAVATTAGGLSNLYVIHVAVASEPGGASSAENVKLAASAALKLAEELKMESIAIPGLGTGAGKVSAEESAGAILEAVRAHRAKCISDITLIDRDETVVQAFVRVLERFDEENA
ncbi:MAG: macro domain-containing protein [Candidatus Krumholzibacteria bacterium]|nr:macro domain-containing protein [Candidatus Krumholzibacteria bacterium]